MIESKYKMNESRSNMNEVKFDETNEFILKYFEKEKNGKFLDVGAYDGIKLSNTYPLWKKGWHGTYIEPSAKIFERLRNNIKERAKFYNMAVSNKSGITTFYDCIEDNGIIAVSSINPEHARSWREGHFAEREKPVKFNEYKTKTTTWNELLNSCGTNFNFINIDVEGNNTIVLNQMPFERLDKLSMVCIEKDELDSDIEYTKIFIKNGFKFEIEINHNMIFSRKNIIFSKQKIKIL